MGLQKINLEPPVKWRHDAMQGAMAGFGPPVHTAACGTMNDQSFGPVFEVSTATFGFLKSLKHVETFGNFSF
jgi:hypothetical protein